MTPIDQLHSDAFFRLLLQGEPGSGKTTLLAGIPGVVIIDIDGNLDGPVRYRRNHGLSVPLGYFRIDRDDKGQPIDSIAGRFARLDAALIECQKLDACTTIGIDSATGLADLMFAKTKVNNPGLKDERNYYGFFLQDAKALMATLTRIRKNFVLTAHERIEVDPMTTSLDKNGQPVGGIKQYRVVWPGQFGDYIGAFFTNVWRTEVTSQGYPPKYSWTVRTRQDTQHPGLKNDYELPVSWEFNWDELQKLLAQSASPARPA